MRNMIVIVDYGLGNLASVKNALDILKIPAVISSDNNVLKKAKSIILPGVGAAGEGMKNLKKNNLDKVIIDQVKKGKPILGLCLGMQLLFTTSEEGNTKCLNIIKGDVRKFKSQLKVPQIGWNEVNIKHVTCNMKHLFQDVRNKSFFYFVHSYYCVPNDSSNISATTDYGIDFCSVIIKGNIYGVQFHPEKSGDNGLKLLENFANISLC